MSNLIQHDWKMMMIYMFTELNDDGIGIPKKLSMLENVAYPPCFYFVCYTTPYNLTTFGCSVHSPDFKFTPNCLGLLNETTFKWYGREGDSKKMVEHERFRCKGETRNNEETHSVNIIWWFPSINSTVHWMFATQFPHRYLQLILRCKPFNLKYINLCALIDSANLNNSL